MTSQHAVTFATTAALLLGLPALCFAAERTFKQTYPLDDSGHVSLSNANGDVTNFCASLAKSSGPSPTPSVRFSPAKNV